MSTAIAQAPAALGTGTSASPDARSLWRDNRRTVVIGSVLVAATVLAGVLRLSDAGDPLDPQSYAPEGARAVAELLRDGGTSVEVVGSVPQAQAAAPGPTDLLLVPLPALLSVEELEALGALDVPTAVVGATQVDLDALGIDALQESSVDAGLRQPACALPVAQAAGPARVGGGLYAPGEQATGAVGCYASRGVASLLVLGDTVLLGAPDALTNERLDEDGNAALALGLLTGGGTVERVLWVVPEAGRAVPGGQQSLGELLPRWVGLGAAWLAVVVVLLALWRGRRLGRVVTEPLPVVVRAAEAVEGRSRLYRAAGARDRAAEVLRAGVRDRLGTRLGLPDDSGRGGLAETLALRTGEDPARIDALLYGAAPPDDAALVRLADELDALSRRAS